MSTYKFLIFFSCFLWLAPLSGQEDQTLKKKHNINVELTQYDIAISYYKKKKDLISLAKSYESKGETLEKHTLYAAVEYYKKALSIYSELDDKEAIIRIRQLLASAYYSIDDYENALANYYELLLFYETNNDTLKIAQTHSSIGSLYSNLHQSDLSFDHQLKVLKLSILLDSKKGIAAISNNIAGLYFELDSIETAFKCVRNAERINTEMDNQYWLSINYSLYADFYRKLGQYDSVRYYLDKSKIHIDESGTAVDSIDFFRKIGIYYFYVDSVPKALHSFNQGILVARRIGNLKADSNLNHWISEIYESRNNMDLALNHLKIHYDLLDSLTKENGKKRVDELRILYHVRELESNLSESKFEQKIATQNIEKTNLQFNGLLLFSIFIITIGFILYLQYRKQLNTNKTLLKLNIDSINAEKSPPSKYSKSNLTDDKKNVILKGFVELVVDGELYKDQELKLETVANELNVSRNYLSQVINETYSQNFNSYINYCRISLAKKYLLSKEYEMYSIKGVAETVGFKSVSSFNAYFKKITGLTPSYYRNNGNAKK